MKRPYIRSTNSNSIAIYTQKNLVNVTKKKKKTPFKIALKGHAPWMKPNKNQVYTLYACMKREKWKPLNMVKKTL
jgi:hypothetical protein